jgi:ClpP class serine protease
MDPKAVEPLATGEMFTATRGKEVGLIDELGDIETAIDMACEMARIPRRLQYVRPRRPLLERILARNSAGLVQAVAAELDTRLQPRVEFR